MGNSWAAAAEDPTALTWKWLNPQEEIYYVKRIWQRRRTTNGRERKADLQLFLLSFIQQRTGHTNQASQPSAAVVHSCFRWLLVGWWWRRRRALSSSSWPVRRRNRDVNAAVKEIIREPRHHKTVTSCGHARERRWLVESSGAHGGLRVGNEPPKNRSISNYLLIDDNKC